MNYVQADEYLDLIKTMVGIPDGPFPQVCRTPLCDPAFVGFYQDLYVVGVIDGLELALAYFMPGNVLRCGDLISSISDASANKMRAIDPRLRGSQGAALTVIQTALERGCTIGPERPLGPGGCSPSGLLLVSLSTAPATRRSGIRGARLKPDCCV